MGAAFAPIHAGKGEAAAESAKRIHVNAERLEGFRAAGREVVGHVRCGGIAGKPAKGGKAIMEGNAEGAGDVIVTGAGGTQRAGGIGYERLSRTAGENAEGFEGVGDAGAVKAVIAMLALSENLDEEEFLEAEEMDAGGGGSDFGEHGEFGAGAGAAVHEAVKHAGPGGFADGGGDGASGGIGISGSRDIHSLMVDESWLRRNWHSGGLTPGRGRRRPNTAAKPNTEAADEADGAGPVARPSATKARRENRDDHYVRDSLPDRSVST
jgi:hypothetical protein